MDKQDFMTLAFQMAAQCQFPSEALGTTPKVGAVIAIGDKLIAMASRGKEEHAEKIALALAEGKDLSEATVYTTLEPCTKHVRRGTLDACADRLAAARVKRVVIGILDPNQMVCGKGVLRLQEAGVEIELFPPDLAAKIIGLNHEFIRTQQSFGIRILDPKHGDSIELGRISVSGTYVSFPQYNDQVIAIVRHGNKWYPQGRIRDLTSGNWQVSVRLGRSGPDHSISIVRVRDAGAALIHYFANVGTLITASQNALRDHLNDQSFKIPLPDGPYLGIEMQSLPKGIDEEDRVDIEVE